MSQKALIVVDVLAGIFELGVPLHEPDAFLANVRLLIGMARDARAPVVYVQHLGPDGSRFARNAPTRAIHKRIAPRPDDVVVEKQHPDSFQGSTLDLTLRERRIAELVVCGFATEACVDTTVRSAYARGFAVLLAQGAHTTTANDVLTAAQIVAHHNLVLARFARVVPHDQITFE
jgi:nicotinamidase-related amidase